jgi:gliding motility-associated-like protein
VTTFGVLYLWTFPGGTPDSSFVEEPGTICYDSSGAFQITLIAFNAYGSDTTIQNIIVDTIPIIEAFPDEAAVSLGNSLDLSVVANGTVTYEWVTTDTASIGDTSLANVTVTPTAPGVITYYVIATGPNGCTNTDSVLVDVELTDVIALPNAFSPNGDGHNDILRVLGPGVKTMHLIVYNRYGQLVFESNDQAVGWDGKHNGKQVDPGVFAWYLEYSLANGLTGLQKGNVTLIR